MRDGQSCDVAIMLISLKNFICTGSLFLSPSIFKGHEVALLLFDPDLPFASGHVQQVLQDVAGGIYLYILEAGVFVRGGLTAEGSI